MAPAKESGLNSKKAVGESLTAFCRDDRGRTDDLLNVTQAL